MPTAGYLTRDDGTKMPVGHHLKDAWDEVMDELEAELYTFQWGVPHRGEAKGEFYVDREKHRLGMTTWVLDNEDSDDGDDEVKPLDVSQDISLFEPVRDQIRDLIHNFLMHEADEQMWFNGERPYYPHTEEE